MPLSAAPGPEAECSNTRGSSQQGRKFLSWFLSCSGFLLRFKVARLYPVRWTCRRSGSRPGPAAEPDPACVPGGSAPGCVAAFECTNAAPGVGWRKRQRLVFVSSLALAFAFASAATSVGGVGDLGGSHHTHGDARALHPVPSLRWVGDRDGLPVKWIVGCFRSCIITFVCVIRSSSSSSIAVSGSRFCGHGMVVTSHIVS